MALAAPAGPGLGAAAGDVAAGGPPGAVLALRWPALGLRHDRGLVLLLSVFWLLLLINVTAPGGGFPDSWCLLAVGGLGMFQNAWLAARETAPDDRNLPLRKVDEVRGRKVMDAIMDFHTTYRVGKPLREEYFPGELRRPRSGGGTANTTSMKTSAPNIPGGADPRRKSQEFVYSQLPGAAGSRTDQQDRPAGTEQQGLSSRTEQQDRAAVEIKFKPPERYGAALGDRLPSAGPRPDNGRSSVHFAARGSRGIL